MVNEFEVIKGIKIKTNDRISIFGRTGTGKTFFAKNWLLPHYDKYVFWDIKHENLDMPHDVLDHNPSDLEHDIKEFGKILYQPESPEVSDFNRVSEIVFQNKNQTLYVDEAALVTTPSSIPRWLNVIMTQGRSYNVGIINVSQRPRVIHNTLISESEHLFVFGLTLDTDIIKLRQQMGDAADEIKFLPEYHLMYYSVRTNKSFIFKPIETVQEIRKNGEITYKVPELKVYRPTLDEYLFITQYSI